MKTSKLKITIAAVAVALLSGSAAADCPQCCGGYPGSPARDLKARLARVQAEGKTIYGHADDTAYGTDWWAEPGRSDVLATAGDYPGLINWDLGMIEMGSDCNLDSVSFDLMRREVLAQHERGGINAFSWHPRNMRTGGDSWSVADTGDLVADIVTPGTKENQRMEQWLGQVARYIASLRTPDGRKVPVIFRPWHEQTGTWFWWGAANTTPEHYRLLWAMTRDAFDRCGADNVVWAFSPDKGDTAEQYMRTYPGDQYVDILGADVYHFNGDPKAETYRRQLAATLGTAKAEAEKRGKIFALTETGNEGLQVADWYNSVLLPEIEKYAPAYVCVWRNALQTKNPGHFYAPYPGHKQTKSFRKFHDDPRILFSKDMSKF